MYNNREIVYVFTLYFSITSENFQPVVVSLENTVGEEWNEMQEGNFFKGLVIGILISIPMWIILIVIGVLLFK